MDLYDGVVFLSSGLCIAGTVSITISPAITDGVYNLIATQTDTAGNVSSSSAPTLVIVVDSIGPSAPIITSIN